MISPLYVGLHNCTRWMEDPSYQGKHPCFNLTGILLLWALVFEAHGVVNLCLLTTDQSMHSCFTHFQDHLQLSCSRHNFGHQ
jgi:hypothetical protein